MGQVMFALRRHVARNYYEGELGGVKGIGRWNEKEI
jgi:hypothetical protein